MLKTKFRPGYFYGAYSHFDVQNMILTNLNILLTSFLEPKVYYVDKKKEKNQ